MSAVPLNPYAAARDALAQALTPSIPSTYKSRLFAQIGLAACLFLMCLVHMVLTLIDLRRRKRPLRLVRLQRLREGKLVVFNALFLYVFFTACSAVLLAACKWKYWDLYFGSKSFHNLVLLVLQMSSAAFLSGLVYTFSNLAAIASISQGGANGLNTAPKLWIWVYNVTMAAVFVINFGCTLPLAIKCNAIVNKLLSDIVNMVVSLDLAAKQFDATGSASAFDAPLAALQAEIEAGTSETRKYVLAILSIGTFFSLGYGAAALASFGFVRKLRKQSQWNRTRQVVTQNSVLVTREEQTIVEQPANGEDTIAMSPIRTAPTARIADGKDVSFGTVPIPTLPFAHTAEPSMDQLAIRTKLKSVAEQSADEAALSRLAYDLSLSLPLILTMSVLFPAISFAGFLAPKTSWSVTELSNDGFTWGELLMNTLIVGFFLVNLVFNTGRYGSQNPGDKTSVSTQSRTKSFQLRMRTQSQLPTVSVNDTGAVQITITDLEGGTNAKEKADEISIEKQEKW